MSQPKDYYAALGLDKEASEVDIKKAYRKLAMTCHPDKNPDDPNAKEKFQAISEAYSILSDPEKKGKYDRGELDDDGADFDMNDFMQAMFGDGFIFNMGGFSGNFDSMFGGMDSDDTEDEEADIIHHFMEMNIKPYGRSGFRCMLCDKKFSTENLMAVHFSRRHREEAMEWAESMDGQMPGMDEAMLMQMMMGAAMMGGGGGMRGGRGGGGMAFPLEFMMMMDDGMDFDGGAGGRGARSKVGGGGGAAAKKKKPAFGKKKSFQ